MPEEQKRKSTLMQSLAKRRRELAMLALLGGAPTQPIEKDTADEDGYTQTMNEEPEDMASELMNDQQQSRIAQQRAQQDQDEGEADDDAEDTSEPSDESDQESEEPTEDEKGGGEDDEKEKEGEEGEEEDKEKEEKEGEEKGEEKKDEQEKPEEGQQPEASAKGEAEGGEDRVSEIKKQKLEKKKKEEEEKKKKEEETKKKGGQEQSGDLAEMLDRSMSAGPALPYWINIKLGVSLWNYIFFRKQEAKSPMIPIFRPLLWKNANPSTPIGVPLPNIILHIGVLMADIAWIMWQIVIFMFPIFMAAAPYLLAAGAVGTVAYWISKIF